MLLSTHKSEVLNVAKQLAKKETNKIAGKDNWLAHFLDGKNVQVSCW